MQILSAATALPQNYYPQRVLLDMFKLHWGERLGRVDVLDKLHSATRVDGRYLAMPIEVYPDVKRWGEYNDVWIREAQALGEAALSQALAQARVDPLELNAIYFVSVTGIASPSIDAMLVNRMKLNPNIKRNPIFGLGCVAGAAGLARAADYVKAYPNDFAALVSVELCSLTLQQEDLSVANLISAGLFGDGAAAVIIGGSERGAHRNGKGGPRILATKSTMYPNTERVMGWDISERGFQIVLSREVPDVARENLGRDVDLFLNEQGIRRADLKSFVLHTGGPRVLEATAAALNLPDDALDASWECLRRTGNLSSASVLFVLEEVMERRRPVPGTLGLLAAMGPGFCSELVLLKW
jgi:alkylresorcinol/alkylpyrone synthase